ncbi:triose-phosphate isomerase [Alkalispirochaeta sphaeroplastigenens]|uniref:Triosephosphate isomerase n=1 Tax=Alkalispirochaeta sphaeroplastigenens TaxID=1187066 RepID=A0A2S4K0I3_9SPIO|nr:triose-phosphate isomerase [Alkalispirochaeta sphaeroplastigenens]POR05267.1 triose-phosphate isomerase [Alkalispirochaeta sphaeroplastigenens]
MRTPFIAGNWKMHMDRAEAKALAQAMKTELAGVPHKLMVAPPFTALETVGAVLQGSNILLGAQNMAPATSGAHTGEISPLMLKDLGVSVVILGHSERRHSYGETDALINEKVRLALQEGLEVILCVGETLEEREANRVNQVVETQMKEGLKGVTADQLENVTIAYEPVWAIGTGKTATPDDADAVHTTVREIVADLYGAGEADKMVIQYGGSVKPDNVKGLMGRDNIDGALVGGASLKTETFVPIAQFDR